MSQNSSVTARAPHLAWVFHGAISGIMDAATYLETTRELRKLGWNVTLISAEPYGKHNLRGVEIIGIPMPRTYGIGQLVFHARAMRFILQQRPLPDIVYFQQPSLIWFLPMRFVNRLFGQQRMLYVMDLRTVHMDPQEHESWRLRTRRLYIELAQRLANVWADGQTAISAHMVDLVHIPEKQQWGVWPSGVNLVSFATAQRSRSWPNDDEPIHIIYVGTLSYERNLAGLCRAVERAHAEGMNFQLSLVGEGAARMALDEIARTTGAWISVCDSIPHEEVPELLATAHVGALPFPDEEKFRVSSPIKLFEYMAAGLPILATRTVCHTDVVGDGTYAFWAEDGDVESLLAALRQLWIARGTLPEKGRAAAEVAPEWTWHQSARKLKDALEFGLKQSDRSKSISSPMVAFDD